MQGIQKVAQRIATIESRIQRLHGAPAPAGGFAAELAKARQNAGTVAPAAAAGSGEVEKMVLSAAARHNVDSRLALAVAKTESGLRQEVVSPAGAVGVMQLMPDTARGLGVRDINDPRENIDGGVRYLKEMLATFDGDVTKAIAAYNAGPNAVKRYSGVPPYAETQDYVSKVLALSR